MCSEKPVNWFWILDLVMCIPEKEAVCVTFMGMYLSKEMVNGYYLFDQVILLNELVLNAI